jgi:hypothetical protein
MHFPANAGLIFLLDKLTNDRYLADMGATLSIVPCMSNAGPSGPLLKGADGQSIPSLGFISKIHPVSGQTVYNQIFASRSSRTHSGHCILEKVFRITVAPGTSQILFACTVTAPAAAKTPLLNVSPIVEMFVSIPSAHKKSLILSLTK